MELEHQFPSGGLRQLFKKNPGGLLYPYRVPLHLLVTLTYYYPADVAADAF